MFPVAPLTHWFPPNDPDNCHNTYFHLDYGDMILAFYLLCRIWAVGVGGNREA